MSEGYAYPDVLSAARAILCDTVRVIADDADDFVVVGGWSPFLLNSGGIHHPGTRDVDVLFKDGGSPGALKGAIKRLRAAGYSYSAKHEFQLLRPLRVGSEEFMFNVDLLHASRCQKNPELFVDHISLPIPVAEFAAGTIAACSIVLPVSEFIFSGHVVEHETTAIAPNGEEIQQAVPLMDELGTLVTKARSMQSVKRPRDAFDVVLAIRQARDWTALVKGALALRDSHPPAFAELEALSKLRDEPRLRRNVTKYWGSDVPEAEWEALLARVDALHEGGGSPHSAEEIR